jgi:hypothetical protein
VVLSRTNEKDLTNIISINISTLRDESIHIRSPFSKGSTAAAGRDLRLRNNKLAHYV